MRGFVVGVEAWLVRETWLVMEVQCLQGVVMWRGVRSCEKGGGGKRGHGGMGKIMCDMV